MQGTEPPQPQPHRAPRITQTRARRLKLALGLYLLCTTILLASAPLRHWRGHTDFNHYALLADCWVHGRLDLAGPPPGYTQNNDFATKDGRWYVSFPPFPAVLLMAPVKLAGGAEKLRDGLFWVFVAGLAPTTLFFALEKLRRRAHSNRSERQNLALAALLALGTVYWFSSVQGTVWFAAHVVSVTLIGLYLWASIDAAHPWAAGLCIALAFATRGPPIALGGCFFVAEAVRTSLRAVAPEPSTTLAERARSLDLKHLARTLVTFALPVAAVLSLVLWHNRVRFGTVFEFGHSYLTVAWRGRIEKWGLFSYHYLARNLGVMLTSLPYLTRAWPHFQINAHGLALWLTSPFFVWLLWPRRRTAVMTSLMVTAALVAVYDLLYQNSGWLQFGYRFSNDYAVYLFALLALSDIRLGRRFWCAAAFAVVVNGFGAFTFDRGTPFYFVDGSQQILYQPD